MLPFLKKSNRNSIWCFKRILVIKIVSKIFLKKRFFCRKNNVSIFSLHICYFLSKSFRKNHETQQCSKVWVIYKLEISRNKFTKLSLGILIDIICLIHLNSVFYRGNFYEFCVFPKFVRLKFKAIKKVRKFYLQFAFLRCYKCCLIFGSLLLK